MPNWIDYTVEGINRLKELIDCCTCGVDEIKSSQPTTTIQCRLASQGSAEGTSQLKAEQEEACKKNKNGAILPGRRNYGQEPLY